jgi:hypothetical protein
MTLQIQQHLAKAIIHHLNGNKEQYEKHARQATELYKRDKHLYVPIEEILREKGIA